MQQQCGPRWDGDPKIGSVWHRSNSRGRGFVINHPAETRHVIDRTLGGDVYFVSGRLYRTAFTERCTLEEWDNWAYEAKQVKR